jgi:hypothetical protein
MIVPCNWLVCMVNVEDNSNNFDASTLRSSWLSPQSTTEQYSRTHQYSQTCTNWDDNRMSYNPNMYPDACSLQPTCPCGKQRMALSVMETLHLELSPQSTTEYSRIHQYSPTSTKWEANKIPWPPYVIRWLFPITQKRITDLGLEKRKYYGTTYILHHCYTYSQIRNVFHYYSASKWTIT